MTKITIVDRGRGPQLSTCRITVLDRSGLEEVAGSAYGISEAEYASVMGQA